MAPRPTLLCAVLATGCGIGTIAALRVLQGDGMARTLADLAVMSAACAAAGALILPEFVAPRAKGWLRPIAGGLLLAPAAMLAALSVDALRQTAGPQFGLDEIVFWLILAATYAAVVGAPLFVAGALAVHFALRRRFRPPG